MTTRPNLRRIRSLIYPGDRGFSLIEVLVSLFMAGVAITAVSLIAVNTNKNQRQAQAYDAATQTANGMAEIARSLSWATVGFTTTSAGFRSQDAKGNYTVVVANAIPALLPLTSTTASGAACPATAPGCQTVRTDIVWLRKPTAPNVLPAVLGKEQIQVTVTSPSLALPVVTTVIRSQTAAESYNITSPPSLVLAALGGGSQTRLTWGAPGARSLIALQRSATADFTSPVTLANPSLSTDHGLFPDLTPIAGAYNYYRVHTTTAAGATSDSATSTMYVPPLLALPTMGGGRALTWDVVKSPDTTSITLQQGTVATGWASATTTIVAANATSVAFVPQFDDTRIFRLVIGVGDGSTSYSNTVTAAVIATPILTIGTIDDIAGTAQVSWNVPPSQFGVPRAGLALGAAGAALVPLDVQSPTATSATVRLPDPTDPMTRGVPLVITLVFESSDGAAIGTVTSASLSFRQMIFPPVNGVQQLAVPDNLNVLMTLTPANTGDSLNASAVLLERSDNPSFVGTPVQIPIGVYDSSVVDQTPVRAVPYWYRLTYTSADGTATTATVVGPVSIQAVPAVVVTANAGTSTAQVTLSASQLSTFGADTIYVDSSTSADFLSNVTTVGVSNTTVPVISPAYPPGFAYERVRFFLGTTEVDSSTYSWVVPSIPSVTMVKNFQIINQAAFVLDRAPGAYGWTGATVTATWTGSPGSVLTTMSSNGPVSRDMNGVTTTQTVAVAAISKGFTIATLAYPADLSMTVTSTGPGLASQTYAPPTPTKKFRSASTCEADCILIHAPATNPDTPGDTWNGNPPAFPATSPAPDAYWNNASYELRFDWAAPAPSTVQGTSTIYIDNNGIVQACLRFWDGTQFLNPCGDLSYTYGVTVYNTNPVTYLRMQSDGNLVAFGAGNIAVWCTATGRSPVGFGSNIQLSLDGTATDVNSGGILRMFRSVTLGVSPYIIWDSNVGRAW